jgi:hypothetical protein
MAEIKTIIIQPMLFTGFRIAVDGSALGPLTAGPNAGYNPTRRSRIIHPVFQSLIDYTSLMPIDYTGAPLRYFKAGHFFIQRRKGDMDHTWFDITGITIRRSQDQDSLSGISLVDFMIGYDKTGKECKWANGGSGDDYIRAPWLEEEQLKRIVERNTARGETDTASLFLKDIFRQAPNVKNRKLKVEKFITFCREVLQKRWQLDEINLSLHHSGKEGRIMARDIRLNSNKEIHYRPASNFIDGYDNRSIRYFPEYECTTPNVGGVPRSNMVCMNE